MLNAHASLGIAQVVFYIPIFPLALCLLVRNWPYRPRMAWWPMIPLSLMRIAGGACIIALEMKPTPDTGLIIASVILLNVGAIPLIVNELGFVRTVLIDNFSDVPIMPRVVRLLRVALLIPIAFLVAGGSVISSSSSLGEKLDLAGYIVFAVILVLLIFLEVYLLTMGSRLIASSQRILIGGLLASPFIIVRNIYGILEVAASKDLRWNPVYGSTLIFAFMALLMEYIAICIWLWVGYSIPPDRGVSRRSPGESGKHSRRRSRRESHRRTPSRHYLRARGESKEGEELDLEAK